MTARSISWVCWLLPDYVHPVEARRAVQQGGVAVNGEKVGSIEASYKPEDINKEDFVLRRGKKNYRKIIFE